METIENIQERVAEVIRRKLDLAKRPELNQRQSDCGADELDQVEIVMALEDEFEIEILDSDPMLETVDTKDCIGFAYSLKDVDTIAARVKVLLEEKEHCLNLNTDKRIEEAETATDEVEACESEGLWYKASWTELRDTGLFRFVNMFLHIFSWAIQMEVGDDGSVSVYPVRCKYDGFSKGDEKMMRKISKFMENDGFFVTNNKRRVRESEEN